MECKLIDMINAPNDLKTLSEEKVKILCKEIREEIISTISNTGGHIASSLGVVELTVAIHKVFNCPDDKIIWDVGHQSYAHKLLTGRRDKFSTIRQEGGISGFPRPSESEYDAFIAGHSSTSISAACGISKANKLDGNNKYTIAIIGDGSLTGGLAYEGLNNAGRDENGRLIVILNDNKMSISPNVGAIANYLSKIRNTTSYFRIKDRLKNEINKLPFLGKKIEKVIIKSKSIVKDSVYHSNFFENLGFEYLGPVDGHDLNSLYSVLIRAKNLSKPVFIHIRTKKGKGYKIAERNPSQYHGISKRQPVQKIKNELQKDFSNIFGEVMIDIASRDKKIIAITAAMKSGTGLAEFSKKFSERFFDVGIAEQHALTFAAGLASNGYKPIFAVYSSFLQRGFDQIIHDASIEKQHIVLAIDRAGIVGEDGETHQGIFDVSFLSLIPGVTIYSPSNYEELKKYLEIALYKHDGVVAVRYPRGKEFECFDEYKASYDKDFHIWHKSGNKTLFITYGRLFSILCKLREEANKSGKNISILKLDKIWPINIDIIRVACEFDKIIFVEESIKSGGIGEHFGIMLMENGYKGRYEIKAIDNQFVPHASMISSFNKLGFNVETLIKSI